MLRALPPGMRWCSRTVTSKPRSASSWAAVIPATPPPRTSTSGTVRCQLEGLTLDRHDAAHVHASDIANEADETLRQARTRTPAAASSRLPMRGAPEYAIDIPERSSAWLDTERHYERVRQAGKGYVHGGAIVIAKAP